MLRFKKINEIAKIPTRAKAGDAGLDVYSVEKSSITIKPGEKYKFPLGLACEFPDNYVLLIQAKSGLASKYGITTIGNVVDSGYRGEIHAMLLNTGQENVIIEPGDKIAQLLLLACWTGEPMEAHFLSESERGSGGFGSSGRK